MDDEHLAAYPAFGKRLRQLRRAMGVKQSTVAELLKVDQATVSRWESGAQVPDRGLQQAAFDALRPARADDRTLRRLVENSSDCMHLVEEAGHVCLAYSVGRAHEWATGRRTLVGTSLWQFATEEIRGAEAALADRGWWDEHSPAPMVFRTSGAIHDRIRISAGNVMWERLYLNDGTPVRLVSGRRNGA